MAAMGKEWGDRIKGEVIVIPYPAQGHINPALALAKCLASKGLLVTFIITTSIAKSAKISVCTSPITIHTISEGSEEMEGPETYFQRLQTAISANLARFIDQNRCCAVIYDSVMPWILEIAQDRGLLGAPFFTQSAAVTAVYYHLKQRGSFCNEEEDGGVVSLPSLPALETGDLPCFHGLGDSEKVVMDHLAHQFSNVGKPDWIFSNTFHNLENEILGWMEKQLPIKTVGPTFLLGPNNDESYDNKNHAINIFAPKGDVCKEWLDLRKTGSVVYVSLGSMVTLGKQQMEELAYGLIESNSCFLWVVRSSEMEKLPQDFTCLAREKGVIVEWCHQPQVLGHGALACFVSHCGWNSTLEALSYGVPIVAMPQWLDQTTNSKFIEDVWRFGVRVKPNSENGIISRQEIAKCIKEVVDGDAGVELKANACKWKDLAYQAVQNAGTSANNIDDFVSKLMCT